MAEGRNTDWERIEAEYRAGERGVETMVSDFVQRPALWAEMGWPEVVSVKRQVRIGRSIVDIVCRHADKSVTLIEVKQSGLSLRDYCTGIGQLAYQAVMAMSDFQTFRVRRILAMPGQFPVDVALACAAGDVDVMPMPTVDHWINTLRSVRAESAVAA